MCHELFESFVLKCAHSELSTIVCRRIRSTRNRVVCWRFQAPEYAISGSKHMPRNTLVPVALRTNAGKPLADLIRVELQ